MNGFVDLHCHSTFSLNDGFGTPKQIAERAVEMGWGAAAITEHGWLGSAPAFYKACVEVGIKPILGCEFYVVPDEALGQKGTEFRSASFHLTALALSKEGYQNLVAWTTFAMQRENFYHKPRISIETMIEMAPWPLHHNVIFSGCLGSELCQSLLHGGGMLSASAYIESMKAAFPNFYIELQSHAITKFDDDAFPSYLALLDNEDFIRDNLIELAEITGTPMVLTNDSHMQWSGQRKAHMAMKASMYRQRDDAHYGASQEQQIAKYVKDYAYFGNYMRDMERIAAHANLPNSVLENVAAIVEESDVRFEILDNFSYTIPDSGYKSPVRTIRKRIQSRLDGLVLKHGSAASERIEQELEAMGDFAHYLLLMSDFLREAKAQGIFTNTRGSAANSLLCYCLEIHEYDSIEYGLTFERFFSATRKKPPDIDIDIEQDRYEDFINNIVIPRMEELEGEGQVVQISSYGTAANRSAFRMAASALGISKEKQDEISKLLPQIIDSGIAEEESQAFEVLKDDYPELYHLTSGIFDSIKSVGQHPCGWLLGTAERPISEWVPLYLIASSNSLVTQFDMDTLSELGWLKGDFLRLKALSVAKRTIRSAGLDMLLHEIPLDDEPTFEMIRDGRTEGVHTLQGRENRRGAIECEVENVFDVMNVVALYRPAHTRLGTDKLYNQRRLGHEVITYEHPIVEEILADTQGIPIFQEQVMEICKAVGMDAAGVDQVYESIKKAKGAGRHAKAAFAKVKPKFFKAAMKTIDNEATVEEIWETYIQGSTGYGFNKGHATSYSVFPVRMAYLKCNYPEHFWASLLSVYPERMRYIAGARSEGFKLLPPSVNVSDGGFTLDQRASGIRIGLKKVKGLGPVAVRDIMAGRPFAHVEDFRERVRKSSVKAPSFEALYSIGAFTDIGSPTTLKGTELDEMQFEVMGMLLHKPYAMRNTKLKHSSPRESQSGWKHLGRERALEFTPNRCSVSKLFWIPTGSKLELKSSPYGHVKTWLMEVIEENGMPMHLMVDDREEKASEVKLMQFLHKKCKGKAFMGDGVIRSPFATDHDGPLGFRFFGIAGARVKEPQVFDVPKTFLTGIWALEQMKYAGRS